MVACPFSSVLLRKFGLGEGRANSEKDIRAELIVNDQGIKSKLEGRQMNVQVKDLLDQAKRLSVDDQIHLADMLYAEAAPSMEEWEAAWVEECERRIGAYERGEVDAIDADEMFAGLKLKYCLK